MSKAPFMYRVRGSKPYQAWHRLKVRFAKWRLERVERVLAAAIRDINRYAIVSPTAARLHRAYEASRPRAFDEKFDR